MAKIRLMRIKVPATPLTILFLIILFLNSSFNRHLDRPNRVRGPTILVEFFQQFEKLSHFFFLGEGKKQVGGRSPLFTGEPTIGIEHWRGVFVPIYVRTAKIFYTGFFEEFEHFFFVLFDRGNNDHFHINHNFYVQSCNTPMAPPTASKQ